MNDQHDLAVIPRSRFTIAVIETPMTEATRQSPGRLEAFLAHIASGRAGQTKDLVGPVIFLRVTCRAT